MGTQNKEVVPLKMPAQQVVSLQWDHFPLNLFTKHLKIGFKKLNYLIYYICGLNICNISEETIQIIDQKVKGNLDLKI